MKLERLIAMLTSLLQKDRIPASWFAEKFNISIRTVYRDVAILENAGIPITTFPGVNGGISILDTYKIDKRTFTQQDITTLLTSLYSIAGSVNEAALNQTLEKIKSLIPKEQSKAIELGTKQLYIDMTPWAGNPIVAENLALIQQALATNQLIQFQYHTRHLVDSTRTAEPHQLVLKEGSWYLRGFCRQRMAFRTFKLSRMENLTLLAQTFTPREFEPGMQDFKDWQHESMITVELVAGACLRERILDFCRPEFVQEAPDGQLYVTMPFVESDMAYGVLLSFGHHCRVLSPPHVKKELARRIGLLAALYTE